MTRLASECSLHRQDTSKMEKQKRPRRIFSLVGWKYVAGVVGVGVVVDAAGAAVVGQWESEWMDS